MIIFTIFVTLFFVIGIPFAISYGIDPCATSNLVKDFFGKPKKYDVQDEMNLFNDAEWVKKVIRSCKTIKQVWNAYELYKLLRNKYKYKVKDSVINLISTEVHNVFDYEHEKIFENETWRYNISSDKKQKR